MNRLRVGAAVVCTVFLLSLILIPFASADLAMFRSDLSHDAVGRDKAARDPPG